MQRTVKVAKVDVAGWDAMRQVSKGIELKNLVCV